MADHIERMIKRCNCRDRPHRLALGIDFSRLAVWRQITGENLAVVNDRHLPGKGENITGSARFVQGVLLTDAKFKRKPGGQLLTPLSDELRRAQQNSLSLVTSELRFVGGGNLKCPGRMFCFAGRHRTNTLLRVGVQHFNNVVGEDFLTANTHTFIAP